MKKRRPTSQNQINFSCALLLYISCFRRSHLPTVSLCPECSLLESSQPTETESGPWSGSGLPRCPASVKCHIPPVGLTLMSTVSSARENHTQIFQTLRHQSTVKCSPNNGLLIFTNLQCFKIFFTLSFVKKNFIVQPKAGTANMEIKIQLGDTTQLHTT